MSPDSDSGSLSPRIQTGTGQMRQERWEYVGVATVSGDGRLMLGWVLRHWGVRRIPQHWQVVNGAPWLRLEPDLLPNSLAVPVVTTAWMTSAGHRYPYVRLQPIRNDVAEVLPRLVAHQSFEVECRASESAVWIRDLGLDDR